MARLFRGRLLHILLDLFSTPNPYLVSVSNSPGHSESRYDDSRSSGMKYAKLYYMTRAFRAHESLMMRF